MDISNYELDIRDHTYLRCFQRGIDPDSIENILKNSETKRLGKHGIKFTNKGNKRTIICIGQIIGMKIKIFTIEEK